MRAGGQGRMGDEEACQAAGERRDAERRRWLRCARAAGVVRTSGLGQENIPSQVIDALGPALILASSSVRRRPLE